MSKAIVLAGFGGPEVLEWQEVTAPIAAAGEILIRVKAAGVGPTDLNIRAGYLAAVFPQKAGSILGFEAAGVVEAIGANVDGVATGDEVVVQLAAQGGYAELVAAKVWFEKPPTVSWTDAAALPASAEAAVGVLHEIDAKPGETLVVLGAAGAVGHIAVQLAVARGLRVIGAASAHDADLVRDLRAEPVEYGDGVFDRIAAITDHVDAVIDAGGHGGLIEAVQATGDPTRVVTLVDPRGASESGARMSEPGPNRAPTALADTMPLLATGSLKLKTSRTVAMTDAAEAHRLLEAGETHDKIVLLAP